MGFGDEIMNAGIAKGARARGYRLAFGDIKKNQIIWHQNAFEIFLNNRNVAPPGHEKADDLIWFESYPGKRPYHRARENGCWIYNPDFKAAPGEIFFSFDETEMIKRVTPFDVIIEPLVKTVAPNKQWGYHRYQRVADILHERGFRIGQLISEHHRPTLRHVLPVLTKNFRSALGILSRARLYLGPEGGLHHGAAALGVGGVVIFGGFTHPRNTGYDTHTNIFVGNEPCGRGAPCAHCKAAMDSISVEQVLAAVTERLGK